MTNVIEVLIDSARYIILMLVLILLLTIAISASG
jgi:hypothetical protein